MMKNPIIPYILIMAFGLGLIFFMSIDGADKKAEIAKGGDKEKTEQTEGKSASGEADPEAIAQQKCISCHGDNLKGNVGPNLHGTGLSEAEVKDILTKGKGGGMPAGLVQGAELDAMAKYISGLK
ncbi:cytochrome c [Rummeliibacillus sp. G93]|uniref:Cytochrome C n=1 Tax=Rummeliibacillus stabekisii TaxID=241244 RepID=A0A143HBE6_9BACL|nr:MULTISPECIES: cytochrome c [Rummeliibacillus]AMW98769.1 cytochrome C [Rummeliibacillus stabekisii]MCM3316116.1 cytochrome c [Rummeliibacillus stabekisii]UQW98675.1 cytochrome c [Rummeliibacillus sp. G93]